MKHENKLFEFRNIYERNDYKDYALGYNLQFKLKKIIKYFLLYRSTYLLCYYVYIN